MRSPSEPRYDRAVIDDPAWSRVVALARRERARRRTAYMLVLFAACLFADRIVQQTAFVAAALAAVGISAWLVLGQERAFRLFTTTPGAIERVDRVLAGGGAALRVTLRTRYVLTIAAGRSDVDELIEIIRQRAAAAALPEARVVSDRA